ncbi:MAG: Gfo/Idh/MocA family protein [Planctomycetaceae bacterium]
MKRRQFLATATAATAPLFIPQRAFGANDRVVTAHIGVGNQGTGNLMRFADNAAVICDVDQTMLEKAAGKFEKEKKRKLELETDFRRILDRKDIDAVVITTPDHWHAIPTILACRAGKDVYCEKPLSLTIDEGKAMVQAARDHQRVVQTGSQQRSSPEFLLACRLVRSGKIGKVKEVHVGIPASNHPYRMRGPVADAVPPSTLDYEFWIGPAPMRLYNVDRVHYNFRFFWDYSGGQMTNFGAHHIDIAHWGLGMDESGPLSVEGSAKFHPDGWIDVPLECRLTYTYPGDVKMIVGQQQSDIKGGTRFIGTEGEIWIDRGKLTSKPDSIVIDAQKEGGDEGLVELYRSTNHHKDFLQCIATRQRPICDVEIGHRSATACHLGNIALRSGKKVQWDAVEQRIVGDSELAQMTARPVREPWNQTFK